jgi:hypothetical protein
MNSLTIFITVLKLFILIKLAANGPGKQTFANWHYFMQIRKPVGFVWGRGAKSVTWQMEFT